MSRMIEMIRQAAVPATIMRTAARGALALPPAEMLEILVYLSTHAIFGEQARLTLAEWDGQSAAAILRDPETPAEVIDYFASPQNLRIPLLPNLLENPSLAAEKIAVLTQSRSVEVLRMLQQSPRILQSPTLSALLRENPEADVGGGGHAGDSNVFELGDDVPSDYEREHAAEIAAEEHKRFELVRGHDEPDVLDEAWNELEQSREPVAAPKQDAATAMAVFAAKAAKKSEERERISTLQKIAKLSVGERVQLAMKGNKDERFILVRDGSKVVALAVLESPKVSETEIEMFAAMKNVQESVLRGIAGKRKFMKSYSVIRALANNPRVPLEVSLPLLSHLLVVDLKNLTMNKNISDTLRKLALKLWKVKSSSRKPSS